MRNKIANFLGGGVYVLLTSLLCVIMFLNLFFHHVRYACRKEFLFSNFVLLTMSACSYVTIAIFLQRKNNPSKFESGNKYSILLFTTMLYLAFNIYFMTNWDSGLIIGNAKTLANGGAISKGWNTEYYSRYPNNQFLLLAETTLFRLNKSLGGWGSDSHFILVAFQCFLYVATGNILYKILREHEHASKYARLGWFNFCILLAYSGWITIPYTDGMSVIFPILILCYNGQRKFLDVSWEIFLFWSLLWSLQKYPNFILFIRFCASASQNNIVNHFRPILVYNYL